MKRLAVVVLLLAAVVYAQKKMPREAPRTPTSVGAIVLTLKSSAAGSVTATIQAQVLDASGARITDFHGDLFDYTTATQEAQIKAVVTAIRAKAESELK